MTFVPEDSRERHMAKSISLIIPAYNEATRIVPTLESYLSVLEAKMMPYEVLVIIDGTDNTEEVVNELGLRNVYGIKFPCKLGRGGAILEGFRRARYDIVGFADADGSVPAKDFSKLLDQCIEGEEVVVASRRLDPSVVVVPERPFRRVIGTIWHSIVRAMTGIQVRDVQCGLKVFSRPAVTIVVRRVTITNRTIDVGMLYHLSNAGYSIKEVPVKYIHDFRTRMPITKAIPVMFLTLVGMVVVNILFQSRSPPRFLEVLNHRLGSV